MIKKLVCLSFTALFLASCGGKSEDYSEIKFITPTGAPALAFYDQGNNENYTTNSVPTNVAAELQKNDYDAVVFDAVNGLTSIKKNNANYKLAKIITAGNFYLASIDNEKSTKTPDEKGNYPLPGKDDIVYSFGENLNPDKVYSTLCKEYWKIENNAKYVAGVTDAQAILKTGKQGTDVVDYVFIAEPALTAVMNNKDAETYGKVHIVKNIRAEWKAYSGQDGLAQAGLFVHNDAIKNKSSKLKEFITHLNSSIQLAITNTDSVAQAMDSYGDAAKQVSRFGFNSSVVKAVQKDNRNGFGLLSPSESIDVNAFLTKLGLSTFTDDYFVSL